MKKSIFAWMLLLTNLCITNGFALDWKEKVAENNMDKVVKLNMYGTFEASFFGVSLGTHPFSSSCTGVYIDKYGAILTAAHCVSFEDGGMAKNIQLTSMTATSLPLSTKELGLDGILVNTDMDLAYIPPSDTEQRVSYAKVSKAKKLNPGQDLMAIGHPLGLDWSVTVGIVSNYVRELYVYGFYTQFDAVIAPGSSGGPVFDKKGYLIGIVSRYRGGPMGSLTGLNFMVDINSIKAFLARVKYTKRSIKEVKRYRIGDIK